MRTISGGEISQRIFERMEAYVRSREPRGSLSFEAVRLLFRCHHALFDIRADIARDHGLAPGHLMSLFLLRACHPDESITPTELRQAVMVSSGGMTKIIHGLEERGFVTRRAHPSDARSSVLVPTEAGVKFMDSLMPLVFERDRELLVDPLEPDELAELIRLLGKIGEAYRIR